MSTPDFFRARLDAMIDLRHPLAVLATRMPWAEIEKSLAPLFARKARMGSARPGVEQLLKTTIETAVSIQAVKKSEFERVIVDTTVQEKAIAHPTDSRLLEVARGQLAEMAKKLGLSPKQTFEREGQALRRKAGGYAHARQFKRLRKVLRRQRTILGVLMRDVQRKMQGLAEAARNQLQDLVERVARIHAQTATKANPSGRGKLYALHAPEVECIGKGKARKPYEFGVKSSLAVTHGQGLIVGARTFPGNPYDGHTLATQLEQTSTLLQDLDVKPTTAIVDLGYRGVDADIAPIELVHRGKSKRLTDKQRRWLKRRQAVEPVIGHVKQDHGMQRCYLKGSEGDALHAVLCAAGYNLRWLLRAIARKGLRALFAPVLWPAMWAAWITSGLRNTHHHALRGAS